MNNTKTAWQCVGSKYYNESLLDVLVSKERVKVLEQS